MTLRELRVARGLSQRAFAFRLGVSSALVSKFERDGRVRDPHAARWAEILGVTPELLRELQPGKLLRRYARFVHCDLCGRRANATDAEGALLLADDYCGSCGRPTSETAKAKEPRAGFVAAMIDRSARRTAGAWPAAWFGDETP